MKKLKFTTIILLLATMAYGQGVAINEDGASPDPSAMLEVTSTEKGILIPRMTEAQRDAIAEPATGLLIFQTDAAAGFYFNAGSAVAPDWQRLGDGGAGQWSLSGANIYYMEGNVGIGTTTPATKQHILGIGDAGTPFMTIENSADNAVSLSFKAPYRTWLIGQNMLHPGPLPPDAFYFYDQNMNAARMVIRGDGNLGIGVNNPMALLHTEGTGTGRGNVLFVGEYKSSNPGNPPATGAGTRMMWYPDKAAFRLGRVAGTGATNWDKDNIGYFSVAMGYNTKAQSLYSIAMGNSTTASNWYSVAIGNSTNALGIGATAMGGFTTALGEYSIALGLGTTAQSFCETVVGMNNTVYSPESYSDWHHNDRLFVIGNGHASGAKSDAMVVMKNGNTGIGISTPSALLHTHGTGTSGGNVLFAGEYKTSAIQQGNPPATGAGTRMMLYPDKAAFRSGRVTGTEWNKDNIGNYSVAMGYNTKALGYGSNAMGVNTTASGVSSNATGSNATALGLGSTAIGYHITAKSYGETVVGIYNTDYAHNSLSTYNPNDRLFVIGNGMGDGAFRSNAMTVMKSGRVGLQTITVPTYALHLPNSTTNGVGRAIANKWFEYSDERVKSQMQPISYGLNDIMKLRPVQYFHHDSETRDDKLLILGSGTPGIGFTAQEVIQIIPELVSIPENDSTELWGLSYNKLTPVLVKAIQEQQNIIEALKTQNKSQQADIVTLKKMIEQQQLQISAIMEMNAANESRVSK